MTNAASTKTKEAVITAAVDLFMTRGTTELLYERLQIKRRSMSH
nr:hypothetical protein [Geomicrobium sp. JCM 19055]